MAQFPLHRLKKTIARTRDPLPGLSVRRTGWNMPGSGESPEVIEADYIDVIQKGAQAIDAPAIASGTERIPVVNRIAPQLPLRAEIVGRNSSDEARPALLIEQEELRVRPNVAGILGNKKRQVTDQAHTVATGVVLELIGLTKQ